jgi:hypothetical protein
MQKRPKAQSSLAQSHLIYVIPVETGIQFIGFVGFIELIGFIELNFIEITQRTQRTQ